MYNVEILKEYSEVLHRSKFHLTDEDDRVFYEVALSEEDSFLVTGNLKHFPHTPKVVTAAQMMEILEQEAL